MYKLKVIENGKDYIRYSIVGDCDSTGEIFIHKKSGHIKVTENKKTPFSYHLRNRALRYYQTGVYPNSDIIALG